MNEDRMKLIRALTCIADPTRLKIAKMLGQQNSTMIARKLYDLPIDAVLDEKKLNRTYRHLRRLKEDGVIRYAEMFGDTNKKDYELTELGRLALIKKKEYEGQDYG